MTYAIVDEVAVELGRSTDSISEAESAQIQQWLGRVERAIEARFARLGLSLDEQVAIGRPSAAVVADVEVAVVARKVRNPEGISSTTKTVAVDDGSLSSTRRFENERVGVDPLELTDLDWARLLPDRLGNRPAAFSVMPS